MGAIANTIAIVVIVCVGYLIIKKVYPTAVLMIAGLVLLCCAVLLDVEPGLALKKGTGSEFFDMAESMGLGVMSLIIVMGVIIGIIAFLMGSGNAPFYSFASIAPAIAEKFGVHAADVLLPLQTMTGFGRTMSPVTGGIVAVAGMAGVSPFRVVKRNMVPLLCCCVVNFLVVYLFILP